jgi:hypothetical protein
VGVSLQIFINGKHYDKEDAKISVYDHGLLYGDGVFEGMRSYGGKVFRMEEHLDRLWDSAKAIWLEIPMSKADQRSASDSDCRFDCTLSGGDVRKRADDHHQQRAAESSGRA